MGHFLLILKSHLTDVELAKTGVADAQMARSNWPTARKVFTQKGGIVQLNPQKLVIRKGSLWIVEQAVPALQDLNTRQHPDSVNGCAGHVAVLGSQGRTGAMEIKDRIKEAHTLEKEGKRACANLTIMVNSQNNGIPNVNALLDSLHEVAIKERERIWPR